MVYRRHGLEAYLGRFGAALTLLLEERRQDWQQARLPFGLISTRSTLDKVLVEAAAAAGLSPATLRTLLPEILVIEEQREDIFITLAGVTKKSSMHTSIVCGSHRRPSGQ